MNGWGQGALPGRASTGLKFWGWNASLPSPLDEREETVYVRPLKKSSADHTAPLNRGQ